MILPFLLAPLFSLRVAGAEPDRGDELDDLEEELDLLQEEAVVELPARHRQEIGLSPSAVTVITRRDIEASGAVSFVDLLRLVPGMDVVRMTRAAAAITSRLSWNDANNELLVLLDGRELNYELLGQPLYELQPIALEDIERIEVIRGPGSALYGANAYAGVVSITTRSIPEGAAGRVRLQGGEAGTAGAYARGSYRAGDFGFALAGLVDRAETFSAPRRDALEAVRLRAEAEWRPAAGHQLQFDGAYAVLREGIMPSAVGDVQGDLELRTARLGYRADALRAQLSWTEIPLTVNSRIPLALGGVELAVVEPLHVDSHVLDGQVQWELPAFWEPLLLIAGANARITLLRSDDLLEPAFADPDSPRFHEPGADHLSWRAGLFAHGELTPWSWLVLTTGARLDYSDETGLFVSPRLAAVMRPWAGHSFRLSGARSFRKPAFIELNLHFDVDFPFSSPIQGTEQDRFREFLTGVLGNPALRNEELWSVEAGYQGTFLGGALTLAWDGYLLERRNRVSIVSELRFDELGRIDYDRSVIRTENVEDRSWGIGSELAVRWSAAEWLGLQAGWSARLVFDGDWSAADTTPVHQLFIGARADTGAGPVASLFLHYRSAFSDPMVTASPSMLDPQVVQELPDVFCLWGRLGWRFAVGDSQLESGLKLMLPFAPAAGDPFRVREKGGFSSPDGSTLGSDVVTRLLAVYLQGSL